MNRAVTTPVHWPSAVITGSISSTVPIAIAPRNNNGIRRTGLTVFFIARPYARRIARAIGKMHGFPPVGNCFPTLPKSALPSGMKRYPARIPSEAALAPPRIPQFHAVHVRIRGDGWTPKRQAEFIGYLAQTQCVTEAARRVGMSRETAYRLRGREWSESFCAAWDAALGDAAVGDAAVGDVAMGDTVSENTALENEGRGKVTADGHGERSHTPQAPKRKVTNAELDWRVKTGLWQLKFHRGVFKMAWRKGDDSALLRLIARLDRAKPSGRTKAEGHRC